MKVLFIHYDVPYVSTLEIFLKSGLFENLKDGEGNLYVVINGQFHEGFLTSDGELKWEKIDDWTD